MSFSYDRAWQDAMAMIRADWVVLLTLTGAFIFFPAFVLFVYAPMPEPGGEAGAAAIDQVINYYRTNIAWFVLVNAISSFAQATILALLLDRSRPTVTEAMALGVGLLPGFFIAQLITNVATGAALVLLIVPGLYLLGRFAVVGPLLMERRIANPLHAVAVAWRATERRGWRIAGLILLVAIVGWITMSAATSALTILLSFVVPEALRPLVAGLSGALSSSALGLLMLVLSAAIYRQVAGNTRLDEIFG